MTKKELWIDPQSIQNQNLDIKPDYDLDMFAHFIEYSAYKELLEANDNCISLNLHESRMNNLLNDIEFLKSELLKIRQATDSFEHGNISALMLINIIMQSEKE